MLKIHPFDTKNAQYYLWQVVQMSYGNKSLNTIDEKLIVADSFLKIMQDDKFKLECLNAFAESHSIIDWIFKEIKGKIFMDYTGVC